MTFIYFCTWSPPFSTHFSQRRKIFLKPSRKNSTICLFIHVLTFLSTSPSESYRLPGRFSLVSGRRWYWHGVEHALYGECGKMERSNFSVACVVVCEVRGLALSYSSTMFFLCFWTLHNRWARVLNSAMCSALVSRKSLRITPTASQKLYQWLFLPKPGFCGPAMRSVHVNSLTHHKQPAFGSEFLMEILSRHSNVGCHFAHTNNTAN